MTSMIPGAAAPPHHQNLSIEKHCYGGYVGGGCTGIGSLSESGYGIMSRLEEGYGCSSEAEEAPSPPCLLLGSSSDLVSVSQQVLMAEQQQDESIRTDQSTVNEAAGSSNSLKDAPQDHADKGDDDHDHGWLQLSIGGLTAATPNNDNNDDTSNKQQQEDDDHPRIQPQVILLDHQGSSRRGRGGIIELDLLPAAGSMISTSTSSEQQLRSFFGPNSMFHIGGPAEFRAPPPRPPPITANYMNTSSSLFLQHPGGPAAGGGTISSSSFPLHQEITNWPANFVRPVPRNALVSSTTLHPSSSSSSASIVVPHPGPYFTRPFQLHAGLGVATARPAGIDFRVIDPPPRRPHSGIWFMLQAAQNQ